MVGRLDRLLNLRLLNPSRGKIARNAQIKSTGFVSVDLELTGLDERRDSIISIGAVKMSGGRIAMSDFFYTLINPNTAFDAQSVTIHSITPADVADSESIGKVLREFLDFCGDNIIIGHCVEIDMAFLGREIKRLTGKKFRNKSVDTLAVYRWLCGRYYHRDSVAAKNPTLYDIAAEFAIPAEIGHHAMMDAYITAQLFQRFIPALQCCGVHQIGDLLRIGDLSRGGLSAPGEFSNF